MRKLPEEPQAVVVVGDESHEPFLPLNDFTEVLKLANILEHEECATGSVQHTPPLWCVDTYKHSFMSE